jgi:hypothetical protein
MRLEFRLLLLGRTLTSNTSMFGPEVTKILSILPVGIGLLVRRQLNVVALLGGVGLCLIGFLALWVEFLPAVANQLGNLGEGKILILDLFPCPVRENYIGRWWPFRGVVVGFWVATILPFRLRANDLRATGTLGAISSLQALARCIKGWAAVQTLKWYAFELSDSALKFLSDVSDDI